MPLKLEMLESPAFRALSLSARRVLDQLMIEHLHHGMRENGNLKATYQNFMKHGINHAAIAPALRELVKLGFIKITRKGGGGNSEHRTPTLYAITCFPSWLPNGEFVLAVNSWRRVETIEQAKQKAAEARAEHDSRFKHSRHRRRLGQRTSNTGVTNATRQRSRELEEWEET